MPKLTKKDLQTLEAVQKKKERTADKVKDILEDICKDNPIIFKKPPECRTKDIKSIKDKMKKIKGCNITNIEDHIRDIAGCRVTCCTIDEIPEVVSLIKKHPAIIKCQVTQKYEDGPDEYGYRGHHLEVTVNVSYENKTIRDTCEIQIRTLAGDLWAVLSHRDLYKPAVKPPALVLKDMRTLSKQMEVVDDLALSLKQRMREEVEKEAREKAKTRYAEKDMLTPKNVMSLISNIFGTDITVDFAYEVMRNLLFHKIHSLKEYKKIITSKKYKKMYQEIFDTSGVVPELRDLLLAPVLLHSEGKKRGYSILRRRARLLREQTIASVEKGVEIPREELEKTAKKTVKDKER